MSAPCRTRPSNSHQVAKSSAPYRVTTPLRNRLNLPNIVRRVREERGTVASPRPGFRVGNPRLAAGARGSPSGRTIIRRVNTSGPQVPNLQPKFTMTSGTFRRGNISRRKILSTGSSPRLEAITNCLTDDSDSSESEDENPVASFHAPGSTSDWEDDPFEPSLFERSPQGREQSFGRELATIHIAISNAEYHLGCTIVRSLDQVQVLLQLEQSRTTLVVRARQFPQEPDDSFTMHQAILEHEASDDAIPDDNASSTINPLIGTEFSRDQIRELGRAFMIDPSFLAPVVAVVPINALTVCRIVNYNYEREGDRLPKASVDGDALPETDTAALPAPDKQSLEVRHAPPRMLVKGEERRNYIEFRIDNLKSPCSAIMVPTPLSVHVLVAGCTLAHDLAKFGLRDTFPEELAQSTKNIENRLSWALRIEAVYLAAGQEVIIKGLG
ncbi:hypothetical protein DFP72DRAFT_846285 [Ephemerocybe angulata]|uniref:Uncharacterized protein n=1 Tax=Ephemerocybe angulata TaxID=980116 RepID=A0A8H6I2V8_9AGAR|nr:hypothetical protein DFP72DRAFT_846285 [Tulosesus angulatus]